MELLAIESKTDDEQQQWTTPTSVNAACDHQVRTLRHNVPINTLVLACLILLLRKVIGS